MNIHETLQWIREQNTIITNSNKNNLIGIGWGPKYIKGERKKDYCINYFVSEKKPLSALSSDEIIPKSVVVKNENLATDVIQAEINITYPTDCHAISDVISPVADSRKRNRPLIGGIETENRWGTFVGTLGFFVRDKTDGQVVALSNNHVLAASQVHAFYNATNNDGYKNIEPLSAFQPTGTYRTTRQDDFYGTAKRCVVIGDINYINTEGIIGSTSCDAAIASVNKNLINSTISPRITGFNANPPFQFASNYEIDSLLDINSPNYKAPVFKCGRTTGPIGYPGNTQSCELSVFMFGPEQVGYYSGYASLFQDCFRVEGSVVPGRGGDSGAAIFALLSANMPSLSAWKCIGLLFAGPGGDYPSYTIGCRITNIASNLNIASWDGTMPTLSSKSTFLVSNEYTNFANSATITLSGRKFYQLGRPG